MTDRPRSNELVVSDFRRNSVESTDSANRQCWICFATDEDDSAASWIQPCNCKGTTKWVHQGCLQQWVNEKQKENRDKKIACPQCKTEYIIFFPKMGKIVVLLDKLDSMVYKICPFVAAGIMVGSLYWTAVTYGAVTVMQVAGQKEAVIVMERVEPFLLLTALPAIPVGLIIFKTFRWEDSLLQFLRKCSSLPVLKTILPSTVLNESGSATEVQVSDGMCCTRVFAGALLLPTIATLCGNMFFNHVQSSVQRALLGGLSFILVKGVVKMYHKQQLYIRLSKRKILDYTPENVQLMAAASVAASSASAQQPGQQSSDLQQSDQQSSSQRVQIISNQQ